MSNYFITGSKGFVGSNLLKKLQQLYPSSAIYTFDEDEIIGDWKIKLENILNNVDIIFHVGANSNTEEKDINKVLFLNYEFSKVLFDLCEDKRIVYSSSAAIYGQGDGIPQTLYAWSKKAAEDYGLSNNSNFIALRYFNVFGPGESHKARMASVAYKAMFHEKHYPKTEYYLFPGNPKRDFIYIDDVVKANISAANDKTIYIDKYRVFDVGTGESHSFEEILDLIGVKYCYFDEYLIPSWYQYLTRADKNKFLPNWAPKYNLENGIKDYLSKI